MLNAPKNVDDQLWFTAVNLQDSNDRFTIVASELQEAKVELIDKLGYAVREHVGKLFLCDADTDEIVAPLRSTTVQRALDEVLQVALWRVDEGTEMIGGSLGSGFSGYDDDAH